MVLYVVSISFCFPKFVPESAFEYLSFVSCFRCFGFGLFDVFCVCGFKIKYVSQRFGMYCTGNLNVEFESQLCVVF